MLDRRAMALGMAALAIGLPGRPASQEAGVEEPRLLANLLTRLGLQVTVNGRRGPVFVLDTGAGRTIVADDLARAWRLPSAAPMLVHGLTASRVSPAARISRLGIGGRRIHGLETPVLPRSSIGADGLVGLDVLGRFRLDLNIAARRVRLSPSGPDVVPLGSASHRATRLPGYDRPARHGRFGVMILRGEAEGLPIDIFVDTGAQYSIGNLALLARIGGDAAGLERTTVYGVTGEVIAAASGSVRDLRLGGQRIGATSLLFADLHAFKVLDLVERPALLIGADLLYRFREVTLDFGRSRIAFRGLRRFS